MSTTDTLDRPNKAGAMGAKLLAFTEIPVIDLAPLYGADRAAREATARDIGTACQTVGFFYIKNHGVPEALIQRTYDLSRKFHESPDELKERVNIAKSPGNRGWQPMTMDDAEDGELFRLVPPGGPEDDYISKPRLHEAFDLSLDIADDDPDYLAGNIMLVPNQWPDWIPGFRHQVMEYFDAVMAVGEQLFRAFAISLDLPEEFFVEKAQKPTSQLRLLRYPANDLPMDNNHVGIRAHSDFECFTILHTGGPGLQVMNAADEWIEAPPIPGAFIVNIGDLLEGWTNGLFKATQHRVINMGKERFSMPLFFAADYETVVEPLPQFVSAENPPRYERIIAGDHLAGFTINGCKHLRKRVLSGDLKIDFPIHAVNPFKRKAVNEFPS